VKRAIVQVIVAMLICGNAHADWLIKTYRNGSPVTGLSDADNLISSGYVIAIADMAEGDMVGFDAGEGTGHFQTNNPVPGITNNAPTDNYAVQGTGWLNIPTTGQYTFGLNTDDGARLRIDGADVIIDNGRSQPHDSAYVTTNLTAGLHYIEWTWFNEAGGTRGGGAEGEIFAAPGVHTGFDSSFQLVGSAPGLVVSLPVSSTADMALVPAGSFIMGNCMNPSEGDATENYELPLHIVYVSAFYMDRYDVMKSLWDSVCQWATNHGYSFDNSGSGKAPNHPVQIVNWYDSLKWCNARSEMEGLTPCYYTDASQTTLYRSGWIDLSNSCVKWTANGYLLPTEAEWEKAARGGASGHRFPWTNTDTIDWSYANYWSCPSCYSYDTASGGADGTFNDGVYPYSNPVGYFATNGYGLYDMAGNVWQWCWDWLDPGWYSDAGATESDTRGPTTSPWNVRVLRGGSWSSVAGAPRCSYRPLISSTLIPSHAANFIGFRCVRITLQNTPIIVSQPSSQFSQVGSNVTFNVLVNGQSPLHYQWQFNGTSLTGATNDSLLLPNVQLADAGGYSVVVTNAYGSATSAIAQLTVIEPLSVTQTNQPPPPPGNSTIPTDPTHFRVFTNGSFVSGLGLDSGKWTVVLTHGWNDSSTNWPLAMANLIEIELGSNTLNIVAWDWTAAAAAPLASAALNTQGQGYALGTNLVAALGVGYPRRIHFIGHGLGTLVNARAANYAHNHGFSWLNTQMTLFDEAEIAWEFGGNAWQTVTTAGQNDSAPQQDWKHPLPDQCAWAENYITAAGMPQPQAVNVILTNLYPDMSNFQNIFDVGVAWWAGQFQTEDTIYHDYPYLWYENTVTQISDPNAPAYLMGFLRSWEGGGYLGRPATGTFYIQSTNAPAGYFSYPDYDPDYNLVQITSDQAQQFLDARPQNLISQMGVNWVNSANNILANNNNQVQAQLWNGLVEDPNTLATGPWFTMATLIKLWTQSPTGSPAYVWIPVTVPPNAVSMSFDFMLQGNGKQDSFQVALNNSNLFSVETILIQTNVTMNSGLIDVSQFAGQQAELFFGIVGGTSTNACVTVSDIAFYVTLPPTLQAQLSGANFILSWPVSANGYVLETTTNLTAPDSWTTVTNVPVVVNFQYTVTNTISGGNHFYRLVDASAIAPPTLQAQLSGTNFILSWPVSANGYVLEATTNLIAPNSWAVVTYAPAIVNLQNIVTNSISNGARFYRLKLE
jgi:formylglycine-generating enzyme required for sulfatase activity/pimeloyl-ACP methyl ester carboxylesterase